jgi:hypothetical protein
MSHRTKAGEVLRSAAEEAQATQRASHEIALQLVRAADAGEHMDVAKLRSDVRGRMRFRSAAAGVTTPAGCAGGAAAQDIKNTKADGDHCGAPRVAPCAPGAAAAHEAGAYSTRALRCNPFTLTRTCARAFGPGQVRTASGIAVVAVMCKPHRCPHIATTGNVCVYCPGGPDSDFEYSTQSYTGCVRARDAGASGAADGHAAGK